MAGGLSLGPLGLAGTGEGTTVLGAIRGRPLGVARALLWHLDAAAADDDANLLPDSASSTIAAGGRSLLQVVREGELCWLGEKPPFRDLAPRCHESVSGSSRV